MAFEAGYFQRAQFPFTPGVPVVFNLNPGLNILRADVIIKATVTITGGTTSGVPIGEGGPVNLIRRIRVIANKPAGSRYPAQAPLVNCSPQSLLRRAMIESNGKYVGELNGSLLGGGDAGVYTIYLSVPIYFGDSVQKNNVQTALNMNPQDSQGNPVYSAVQVQVELAASIDELFAGSDRVMTVAGMVNYGDIRLGLSTDTTPLFQEDHYALIQAPNEEFVDPAMPADGAFTEWLIMAQQGTPWLAALRCHPQPDRSAGQLAELQVALAGHSPGDD